MSDENAPAFILDTSVAVRWFIDQPGYEHAREVLEEFRADKIRLLTPDMSRVELGHVLRNQGYLKKLLTRQEVLDGARMLDDIDVQVLLTDADHLERAAALALDHNLRFFDAVFVVHALEHGVPLITGDGKLSRAVAGKASVVLLRGIGP